MKKYRIINIVLGVLISIIMIGNAFIFSFKTKIIYKMDYIKEDIYETTQIAPVEAKINYGNVVDSFTLLNERNIELLTINADKENIEKLNKLKESYRKIEIGMIVLFIIAAVGIYYMSKKRRFECFFWGGIFNFLFIFIAPLVVYIFNNSLFHKATQIVFKGNYLEIFPVNDLFVQVIPKGFPLHSMVVALLYLFLFTVGSVWFYLNKRKGKPHKF